MILNQNKAFTPGDLMNNSNRIGIHFPKKRRTDVNARLGYTYNYIKKAIALHLMKMCDV